MSSSPGSPRLPLQWLVLLAGIAVAYLIGSGRIGVTRPIAGSSRDAASVDSPDDSTDVASRPSGAAADSTLIFAGGVVEGSRRELALRFEIPGRIAKLHVAEGDVVEAGRPLAELDPAAAEAAVLEAQQQWRLAAAERDRLLKSPHSLEDETVADGRIALAESSVRRARLQLDQCRLTAPFAGTIVAAVCQVGELTGPAADPAPLVLVERRTTRVRAFVEELDAGRVAPGRPAIVRAPGDPSTYRGRVESCAASVRPKHYRHLNPGERLDVRVREIVVDLDDGADLLLGLPVDVYIQAP